MNRFTKKLAFTSAVLGAFLYTEAAEAYAWAFTNTLNEKIAVDVYGIARIGGSMFQEQQK